MCRCEYFNKKKFFHFSTLQERPHELLDTCVVKFEREFENLLIKDFAEHDFKHMTGYAF